MPLRALVYGIILPTICALGIIGNVLNLIVLTRRNMHGTAYIYMRGKCIYARSAIYKCIYAIESFYDFFYDECLFVVYHTGYIRYKKKLEGTWW